MGAALDKPTAAYSALVKSDVAPQEKPDKSALEALVAEAGKLDAEGKTPALVERLNAAIAGANVVLGDDAATGISGAIAAFFGAFRRRKDK